MTEPQLHLNEKKPQTTTMVERTGPEIFKFEHPGAYLKGRLISIETMELNGKPTLKYLVDDKDEDRLFSFLGTVDLNTKIRPSDIGRIVEIRYGGQDPQSENGKNPIKRFKVFVEQ
jgi:hypothetical protein